MGQNYSSAVADGNVRAGIDIPELHDLTYDKSLGTARFLKTIRARRRGGRHVVAKLFVKPPAAVFPLKRYLRRLELERAALEDVPNAYPYQVIFETERCGYMIRQYMYSSLYDRISTRPFLEIIEKRWITFQLLCALRDCHAKGVHHGDIKSENVLVTSWNWIFLADFASFKPTYLPADNPADFSYYFDTSARRICYVAPERFLDAGQKKEDKSLTDSMDVFSLGCVIAELFLEGTPMFTLSQLFKYRSGEYDPSPQLAKIDDQEIRALVRHMINLDPEQRCSAEQYLNDWRRKAFPEYFYSFLHQYLSFITDPASVKGVTVDDQSPISLPDERIDRIYHDFDKIAFFLGYDQNQDSVGEERAQDDIFPLNLDIPNYQRRNSAIRKRSVSSDDGTLIFLSLIASSLRNTSRATARVRACDIILAFAERITDEAKMNRCLPYLIMLMNDRSISVQVASMRAVAQLMELIETASPVNSHVFPDYIIPKLSSFCESESVLVRATYASCLASFASSASRFLDMTQAMRAEGALPMVDPEAEAGSDAATAYQTLFDTSRNDIGGPFEDHTKALITDPEVAVRRAFLRSVSTMCVFFGTTKANDVILSHLNTYLNDNDWMLRYAFFETITGIATYLGSVALEDYIMPLMVQSLTDPEEFVVEKVLKSLASMAELGLFQRSKTWELVDVVGRFTMHPNIWIRENAVGFIASSTKWIAPADVHCILYPCIRPFLRAQIMDFSALNILENLKKPISRTVFDTAVQWAEKSPESPFWRSAQGQRTFVFGSGNYGIPKGSDSRYEDGFKASKNKEDEQWLSRLRNLGMPPGEEWKITALREYIWRMARSKSRLAPLDNVENLSFLNKTISLQQLNITPMNIIFEDSENFFGLAMTTNASTRSTTRPTTIAEALIDASRTIDKPLSRSNSGLQLRRVASDIRRQQRLEANGVSLSGTTTPKAPHIQLETNPDAPNAINPVPIPEVNVSSINGSPTSIASFDSAATMRRTLSKNSLLNRNIRSQSSKAAAETSTVSATVFGKVEPPFPKQALDSGLGQEIEAKMEPEMNFRAAHNYDGNDPYILKLLDSIYLQNYPMDIVEFGPQIAPLQRRPIRKSTGRNGGVWKPEGSLVASFGEHTAAVNRVCVCADHNFFITASDDGTVKIWDTTRLEKNVSFKARQTYKHGTTPGTKVKALCFLEDTRCFASGASDGTIHIVKVDYQTTGAKYGKLRVRREWKLPVTNESAVWMEHFKSDSNSILLIATTFSNIYALDLRNMGILYTLQNPLQHGTPTCFTVDRKHNWLVLGTSHGILSMWDLRFQLRLKSFGLPGGTPIHRLGLHPNRSRNKLVLVAGGTGHSEISTWDIEKSQCREVYRASSATVDPGRGYESWNVDDEASEQLLSRFSKTLETSAIDRGIRAFITGIDVEDLGTSRGNTVGASSKSTLPAFIITGGADRKIRYWNLSKIENSMIVSGLDVEDIKPTFSSSHLTPNLLLSTERVGNDLTADRERGSSVSGGGSSAGGSSVSRHRGSRARSDAGREREEKRKKVNRVSRTTVISQQQQVLLKNHLDTILDVAFLEVPYGMIVSVDRSGLVFVYQ